MEKRKLSGALRISASAGSGKTYRLTRLYLELALESPVAYRSLLAVTFTIKAARELKERITSLLFELARGEAHPRDLEYFAHLGDGPRLQERARQVLSQILFDTERFHVLTIDSFFQLLFRQVAYEARLPPGLQTELDLDYVKADLLREGLDRLDAETRKKLTENLLENLRTSGKTFRPRWYIESQVVEKVMADRILGVQFGPEWDQFSTEGIAQARKAIEDRMKQTETEAARLATAILRHFTARGWSLATLAPTADQYLITAWQKLTENAAGRIDVWVSYKSWAEGKLYRPDKARADAEMDAALAPLLMDYHEFSTRSSPEYSLMKKAREFLRSAGILVFFLEVLRQRNAETGRVLLGEIKFLLSSLIGDSDVPFLLEKTGNRLEALLIDEFQDTDPIQWRVFLPLAVHVVSKGGFFAAVGDPKQSIYRWRGGDSSLFVEGIKNGLHPFPVGEDPLLENRRSEPLIVHFNNWLFSRLPGLIAEGLEKNGYALRNEAWENRIQENYQDVKQILPGEKSRREEGFLRIRIGEMTRSDEEGENGSGEDGDTNNWTMVVEELYRLQAAGIPSPDIAVILRTNKHLTQLKEALEQAALTSDRPEFYRCKATADLPLGQNPLYSFLALALQSAGDGTLADFAAMELEARAETLALDERFYPAPPGTAPAWRQEWREQIRDSPRKSTPALFLGVLGFFGLRGRHSLEEGLLFFENLVLQYEASQRGHYLRFADWWHEKGSKKTLPATTDGPGITLITVHKSKGLAFPVVVLPMKSNSKIDNPHPDPFWFHSEEEPWNAFPVYSAGSSAAYLNSSLGPAFQNETYASALEELNVFYVACTRARYGLVVLIDMPKPKPSKSGNKTSKEHLRHKAAQLIAEAGGNGTLPFRAACTWDENGHGWLESGSVKPVVYPGEESRPGKDLELRPVFPDNFSFPVAVRETDTPEQETGTLVHRVLEQTRDAADWENGLNRVIGSGLQKDPRAENARKILATGFAEPALREWFNPAFPAFPELEIQNESGERVRADRLVKRDDGWVVLDFKTGEPREADQKQIAGYARLCTAILKEPVRACLLYWNLGKAEWVKTA